MSLKPAFVKKLQYLLTVGYNQKVITSFIEYCKEEVFDEDSIVDDLDDLSDSSIMEHLQTIYNWNDQQLNDFHLKLRQALDIDPKPSKQQSISKQTTSSNGYNNKSASNGHSSKPNKSKKPSSKLYISASHIDYNLTKEELEQHKQVYFQQCPRLLPLDQRSGDETLLKVLAIGRKNNTPLLQNIADTYSRFRINQYLEDKRSDLEPAQFARKYEYFRKLKRNNNETEECLSSALSSFHRRICPRIQFKSLLRINDSIADYFEYVSATIKFIHNLVVSKDAMPPFQVDFWIIPKNVKSGMTTQIGNFQNIIDEDTDDEDDEDDDEDESDDDYKTEFLNAKLAEEKIGNIESRLNHEKCLYDADTVDFNSPLLNKPNRRFERELDKKCKDFLKKRQDALRAEYNQKYHRKYVEPDPTSTHKTRLCIVIDRRRPKDDKSDIDSPKSSDSGQKKTWNDRIYIYDPPTNCNSIPNGHVPESFFNASKECMLPGKGYNNGKREELEAVDDNKFDKNIKQLYIEDDDKETDTEDIEVGDGVGGYQFTLSFHVQAIDDIKCYIFYNSWISRFFPQDMVDIWPLWFDESKENRDFIQNSKKWKTRINDLQTMLCDDQFVSWYKDTTKSRNLLKTY